MSRLRSSGVKVSIILPAYNEEDNIGEVIGLVSQRFRSMGLDYEVIVVDDGSEDETRIRASEYRIDGRVRVFGYDRNMGKGYALRCGAMHAEGDYVIFMDSDLEIDPRRVEDYLHALEYADVVVGSKRHPLARYEAPAMRKFLSMGFHFLTMILTGIRVGDTQTGLKAFRRSALEKIVRMQLVKRYAFDVEVLALATLMGMRIEELPADITQTASFGLRSVLYMLIDLMGIVYRLRIKKWYQKNLDNERPTYRPLLRV